MRKVTPRMITHVALFIALDIVLTRFVSPIYSQWIRISLSFIPLVICAIMYGPVWAAFAGCMADFIGFWLNPIGAYYPPLLITITLNAMNYWFWLNPKANPNALRTTAAAAFSAFGLTLGLQTLWLSTLYNVPYEAMFATRTFQAVVVFVLQSIFLPLLVKVTDQLNRQFGIYQTGT